MISKKTYETLKNEYGAVASWAIWAPEGATAKSNVGSLEPFKNDAITDILGTDFVFVGYNCAAHPDSVIGDFAWHNYHSDYAAGNDYKLRYAFKGTRYWGSYMTDIIKYLPETNSANVDAYLRKNPDVVKKNVEDFKREISILSPEKLPILVAFGGKTYALLNKYLGKEYTVVSIQHFSFTIGKEEYRKQTLEVLDRYENDGSTENVPQMEEIAEAEVSRSNDEKTLLVSTAGLAIDESAECAERYRRALKITREYFKEPEFEVRERTNKHDIPIRRNGVDIGGIYVGTESKRTEYKAYSLFVNDPVKRSDSRYSFSRLKEGDEYSGFRVRLNTFEECISELIRLYKLG